MPNMIVGGLIVLAALLVFIGVKFAQGRKSPKLFRAGAFIAAAGITLLWLLPWWLFSTDRGDWAMPIFIGAFFVSVSFLGLGIQLIAHSCGAREESHGDALFEDFLRQNDL